MTYRFRRSLFVIVGGLGMGTLAFGGGCGGDDSTATATDAATTDSPVADVGPAEASTMDAAPDAKPPPPFSANIGIFNARSQAKASIGVPEILIPSSLIQVRSSHPARKPDLFIPGPFAPLGCTAVKYTSIDPKAAGGPGETDGDLGIISIGGFTGGATAAGPIPNPLVCTRTEIAAGLGLFSYNCDFPAGPASGFLVPTDKLNISAMGGADSKAITIPTLTPSPIDNLVVTNDLWATTGANLDGTADFTLNYTCGAGADAGACGNATLVAVLINTTDFVAPDAGADAGPTSPFAFGNPQATFGSIVCIDLFATHAAAYAVPKAALAELPTNWTAARVLVATVNAGQGISSDGIPASAFAGAGVFGITHR